LTDNIADNDLERSAVAGALFDPEYRDYVLAKLTKADFTSPACRELFEWMQKIAPACKSEDEFTELKRQHLTGKLSDMKWILQDYFPASIEKCVERVRQITIYRQFRKLTDGFDYNPERFDDLIAQMDKIGRLGRYQIESEPALTDYVGRAYEKLENAYNYYHRKQKPKAFPLFLPYLRRRLNGVYPGEYWIIAGRPGHGKSTFAMNMAVHGAKHGERPLVVTLEMPPEDYLLRAACMATRRDSTQVRTGDMDTDCFLEIGAAVTALQSTGLDFLNIDNATIDQLLPKIRARVASHNATAVFLDQINNIDTGARRPYEAMTDASRKLRGLAKELQLPVVVVSQLNRELEKRSGEKKAKLPRLSDLRESGALEQDAVVVIMLCWPYKITSDRSSLNTYWLSIAKSRYTHTGQIKDRFKIYPESSQILEVTDDYHH